MAWDPGPVLRVELLVTARRGRYYAARVAYGLFLLLALWVEYRSLSALNPQLATIYNMGRFAESTFLAFAGGQGLAMLVLVPALVAGTIADERQRNTLPDLLATGLTAGEIVLGKLGARLLHAGVFLLLGLPVVCLVGLFGGLDPWDVLAVTLGTISVTLFVAGLSILVSVVAPRPRRAIVTAYSLVATWLIVPPMLGVLAPHFAWPLWWVKPVNDLVLLTHPGLVWGKMSGVVQTRFYDPPGLNPWTVMMANEAFHSLVMMAWLQLVSAALFVVLAVWLIRPFRGVSIGRGSRRGRGRRPAASGPVAAVMRRRSDVLEGAVCAGGPAVVAVELAGGAGTGRPGRLLPVRRRASGVRDDGAIRSWSHARQRADELEPRAAGGRCVRLRDRRARRGRRGGVERDGRARAGDLDGPDDDPADRARDRPRQAVRGRLERTRLVATVLAIWGVGLLGGAIGLLGFLRAVTGLVVFLGFASGLGLLVSLKAQEHVAHPDRDDRGPVRVEPGRRRWPHGPGIGRGRASCWPDWRLMSSRRRRSRRSASGRPRCSKRADRGNRARPRRSADRRARPDRARPGRPGPRPRGDPGDPGGVPHPRPLPRPPVVPSNGVAPGPGLR